MNPLRASGPPWVIGHRGAAARAPENTLPSFRAAWAAGAGWVEADVQPTADGVPVILHDDDLDRTTDGTGPLRSRAAPAVATLDAGGWFGPEFAGTRVPTLAELLSALAAEDRRLLLEIKGDHTARQIQAVLDQIRAGGVGERVFLESFELDALRMVREILPEEPVGLLVERIDHDPLAACRQLGATSYNPEFRELLARPDLVGRLHEADIAVMVWTADEPSDWARLTDLGVDAIITDDPGALLAWQAGR